MDLSAKEWEKYGKPEHSHVYKQIATVMHKGIKPEEVAKFYDTWAEGREYENVRFYITIYCQNIR
jgi:hypothetical protein